MVCIYDLEVFPNFFLAGFLMKSTGNIVIFEISEWKNDAAELDAFLQQQGLKLIGYNNLNYDYPIIHYLLNSRVLVSIGDPDFLTQFIYKRSCDLLNREFTSIPEWEVLIPQLDLFRIHHLDNVSKSATLKDIEFNIRHENVEDLVIPPHSYLMKGEDDEVRDDVIKYNKNDLIATQKFYNKSKKEIKLRKDLSVKYKLRLLNANDPKMGSEIFASKLAPALGITVKELKSRQTFRQFVKLSDCIFPYINFKTPVLQEVLEEAKNVTVYEGATKGAWTRKVSFGGIKYKIGLGGIHGCIDSGFYCEDNDKVIVSSDVVSYYPNLSIQNHFYPKHLTSIYCDVYYELFRERGMYPKGTPENYGLKIALNGSFGKSNDNWSFFKDLKYFLTTTVNGQLLILMWCERIQHLGQILMANTDGIEILIPKSNLAEYYEICKRWEKFTRLTLEHSRYKSIVIRDVNNYRAIFHNEDEAVDEDKEYEKGVFVIKRKIYQDHSQLIVPKALNAYYQKGIPIKDYIRNHDDIFDFYIRLKIKSNFSGEIRYVAGQNINTIKLSKTTRYYASTRGGYIYRIDSKGKATAIRKGQKCTIANKHEVKPIKDYNIDYLYYERECYKIINAVNEGQTFHSINFQQ